MVIKTFDYFGTHGSAIVFPPCALYEIGAGGFEESGDIIYSYSTGILYGIGFQKTPIFAKIRELCACATARVRLDYS